MNTERIVTAYNDSLFVTNDNNDSGSLWLAIIDEESGRAIEIELDTKALGELRDLLNELDK